MRFDFFFSTGLKILVEYSWNQSQRLQSQILVATLNYMVHSCLKGHIWLGRRNYCNTTNWALVEYTAQ